MNVLNSIVSLWLEQIEQSRKRKHEQFGKTADRAWSFLGKSYRDLYLTRTEDSEDAFPHLTGPYYKTRLNKAREFVSLMLPAISNRVPTRTVMPRRPPVPAALAQFVPGASIDPTPQEQQLCFLMQWWLNYIPGEYGLLRESRTAVQEALVKGRGVLWHELVEAPTGLVPASNFDSVDNLFVDPDCKQMRDAGWIVRRREQPVWKVAEMFDLKADALRGSYDSQFHKAWKQASGSEDEKDKGDICVWYEVWSRMGIGHKLFGAEKDLKDFYDTLDAVGLNVWLAIMPGVKHPLNINPELIRNFTEAELKKRLEWPIAFYEEFANPWPMSCLDFYPNGDNPWASSPLEAALPMQIFLDHLYSYIMSRVRVTCRDIILVSKALEEQVKNAIVNGLDQEVVEVDAASGAEIAKMAHVLQFPTVNRDLWQVVNIVERAFERASGLDPLIYGSQPSAVPRSAAEVQVRDSHLNSRPEDFADCVENWQSAIAAKEAQATRLYVGPDTVAPLFGEAQQSPEMGGMLGPLTQAWATLVNTDDPGIAASELSYSVETGTGRKKNKQKLAQDAQQLTQTLLQPLIAFGQQTGNFEPYNALMDVIGQAYDIPMQRLMLQGMPPPMPAPTAPSPEAQDAPME